MMDSVKKLPIENPIITSVPWHACYLSILSVHQECNPWIYSKFIQLQHEPHPEHFRIGFLVLHADDRDICPWLWRNNQRLNKDMLDMLLNESNLSFSDLIMKWIDMNYYVSIDLNDFYVPIHSNYNKHHTYHESLIYGYDKLHKTFNVCGFYENNRFCFEELDFKTVEASFLKNELATQDNPPIRLLKFNKTAAFDFELDTFMKHLKDYVRSENTQQNYSIYRNTSKTAIYGMAIYDEFRKEFAASKRKGLFMRSCYTLWNHKFYLLGCFDYICHHLHIDYFKEVGQAYRYVEKEVKKILLRTIKHDITQDDMLMEKNIQAIDRVKKVEHDILTDLLHHTF